ncbi:hypothetical protein RUM44_001800 [Polyplax serrata]|uniref:Lateral signaling target protein 2 homolog n=1 Tax=Polyplax serrata TaxID=468196 RepID=A0ABR1AMU8_POLSC
MESFRKWFYKPKRDDSSLLAQFFYADEDLNTVTAELDSFDGRKDPERCSILVNHLRQCQDKVLNICGKIMNQLIPNERASRDFRVKFPDDVMQENLAGQLWFGAECLAAGSSIMNRESESSDMRPLAKALTKSLENVRNLLREQCFRMNANIQTSSPLFNDKLLEALKIFDRLFAEFELHYVSAMVPVKSPREYYLQQLIVVLFSETLQRALRLSLLTQEMIDDYDPALMFAIPRLAIVSGLLIFPDGPICVDGVPADMSEMFRPFWTLLRKIRALLLTLSNKELFTLEKLLCSCEDPNIDFSDTNSYSKCLEENEKHEEKDGVENERTDYDYIEDDVDYESIGSTGNRASDGVNCLPPLLDLSDIVPSESATESAFPPAKTESISISNDTNTSGYLIANQVNLNCITTPNEVPIIVGHSLPDGDHDESLNLVTETLSSLLNTSANDSAANVLDVNVNNSNFNSNDEVCQCTYFNYDGNSSESELTGTETTLLEDRHFETGILKTDVIKCKSNEHKNSYADQSDRLVSPDSGLENSEVDNTISERSLDEKMISPSTSKDTSSPSSDKQECICDICGKVRTDRQSSNLKGIGDAYIGNGMSPFLNQSLKDTSLLDQCNKMTEENGTVVEERNEEWYGIAVGQGDVKTSDVNFYFQNERQSDSPSHSELQQNYCSNWEALIPFTTVGQAQVDSSGGDSVSLDVPTNFVISVADERQIGSTPEIYRIRTSTLIPLQNFENSGHGRGGRANFCRRLGILNVTKRGNLSKQKKSHKSRNSSGSNSNNFNNNNIPRPRENAPVQLASHSKRGSDPPQIGSSFSSSCSSCVTSETCSLSSDTSSFNSELQDDEEIALALKAAEAAYRDDTRARFKSSEDLIHRLFVCIAGVADQLQTNFAGDLRNILKSVFLMNATGSESEDEAEDQYNVPNGSADLARVENAEEAWENSTPPETDRSEESTSAEGTSRVEESRKEKENPPPWIPDVMAPRCMTCGAVFTLVRRRHHCRNCGKVFCARCSSNSVPLPRYGHIKPVRVCNCCFLCQVTPFTIEEISTSS